MEDIPRAMNLGGAAWVFSLIADYVRAHSLIWILILQGIASKLGATRSKPSTRTESPSPSSDTDASVANNDVSDELTLDEALNCAPPAPSTLGRNYSAGIVGHGQDAVSHCTTEEKSKKRRESLSRRASRRINVCSIM
jgi:hypothetical protein